MLGSFQIKTNTVNDINLFAFNTYTGDTIGDKLKQIELNKDPKEKAIALGNLAKDISFTSGNKKDSIRIFIRALSIRRGKDDWTHYFTKVFILIAGSGLSQKEKTEVFKAYLKDIGFQAQNDDMLTFETTVFLCEIGGVMLSQGYSRAEALQVYKMAFAVAVTIVNQNEKQKAMNIIFMLMKNWDYKKEEIEKLLKEVQASN